MYHSISPVDGTQHPYFETRTSAEVFAQQMQFLSNHGYATVSLADVMAGKDSDSDKKQVVITFDDGFHDFYTHAFPILGKNGFSATMFIVSTYPREPRLSRNGTGYMTWAEIREIHAHGIRIGSHTATHPQLSTLSEEQVRRELSDSKATIEDELGEKIVSFSYPFAFPEPDTRFTFELQQTLQSCGYENGVSTMIGTARPEGEKFFLPRLPVNSFDDTSLFRAKLEGGYDWLRAVQRLYKKRLKRTKSTATLANARSC